MDLAKYNGRTADLINKVLETVHNPNSHVFSRLKELEETAKGGEDVELLGFVYYQYALAYYTRGKHKEILHYLKQAIRYLVRQDDRDLLAASYNVFAIEAKTNGCFEVALDYYLTAHYLVEEDKDSLAYAMTGANIADLLTQMGEYKNAYSYTKFIKQAIQIIEKSKDQIASLANRILFHTNLGFIALTNRKYKEAREEEAKLREIGEPVIREMGETIELYYLVFALRLAIVAQEKAKIRDYVNEIQKIISSGVVLSELVQEIIGIIDELIQQGDLKSADQLLYTLEKKTKMNSYASMLFTELKIKYYDALGDKKKRRECYALRSDQLQKYIETKNFIYYESITLMEMLEELRREEEMIRLDNISIQKNAETDSLTGIPNRYAMDRYLDYYFSEAKKNQVPLGIGIVDIDCFKKYNDNHGHLRGDRCLIDVAKTLEKIAQRRGLSLARYGGDEFVLVYYNLQSKQIRAIEKEILNQMSVSVTHGFYNAVPKVDTKIYDYLSKADQDLYRNKKKSGVYDTWT